MCEKFECRTRPDFKKQLLNGKMVSLWGYVYGWNSEVRTFSFNRKTASILKLFRVATKTENLKETAVRVEEYENGLA